MEDYRFGKFCYFGQDLDKSVPYTWFLHPKRKGLKQRCLPSLTRSQELGFGATFIRGMITRGYLLLRQGFTG